jgi:hypothetical protein
MFWPGVVAGMAFVAFGAFFLLNVGGVAVKTARAWPTWLSGGLHYPSTDPGTWRTMGGYCVFLGCVFLGVSAGLIH